MTEPAASAFPAVVHTYTDALRLLRDEGPLTLQQVADLTGRVKSNLRRDKPRLIEAGVLSCDDDNSEMLTVLSPGLKWVEGQDVAEGRALASLGGGNAAPHAMFMPDPDNARRDWDSDEAKADLEALAADIAANGLLQNLVVRANPDPLEAREFVIVGGERRWRSVGLLIERGLWPADRELPYHRLFTDEVGVRLAALAENLQRRNLNPIEEANAYRGLREVGLTTEQIAERVTLTQRHVQMRLQLLDLTEEQQARMILPADDPKRLSVSDARKLVQNLEAKRKARDKWEATLTARQRLILFEIYAVQNFYLYSRAEVDPVAIAADPDAIALEQAGLLTLPTTRSAADGRAYVRLDQAAHAPLTALGGDDPETYAALLRAELGLPQPTATFDVEGLNDGPDDPPSEAFTTPWLNGPFEIPADIAAEVEAAQKAQDEKVAANIAAREAQDAERAALAERGRLAAERAAAFISDARSGLVSATIPDQLADIAAEADAPLPWRVSANGGLIAADGSPIVHGGNALIADRGLARMRLLAFAMNSAAGLETPEDEPAPEPEPEQAIDGTDPDASEDEEDADGDDD